MSNPEFGSPFGSAEVLASEPVRRGSKRWVIAGVVAAAVAAGGVGVAAAASSPTPSAGQSGAASPSASPSEGQKVGPGKIGHMRGGMFGALHGEFVVPKEEGGFQTLATQQGTVTAVDGSSITVKSEDDYSRTYAINDSTRVNGGREGVGSIQVNDQVSVMATVEGQNATATMIVDLTRPAEGPWSGRHFKGSAPGFGERFEKRFGPDGEKFPGHKSIDPSQPPTSETPETPATPETPTPTA
ncbi:hypothetical protein [Acrocarpospora catenulata]|uniref:hypothetical protein n=1 Tax=Acrocarpospora catenulata TaxID=2836182 RepID=UPI001BD92309|nr:hypothetical protein [Acrocarpospora catenulata]